MSSRRVTKGASVSKSEKDGAVPTIVKGAQRPTVASKKFAKQQKSVMTPPSEKAPTNFRTGRGLRRPLPRRSRRRPQASVHRLPSQ
ncbi:hypothetical protein EVAR_43315_1 [Eumeta japonica]|uniref:Uncharacterized protein n=1 Tax=Eumeta variegata TaxID=151549 RepID=A0A4C1WQ96_EUMVA|nr:hypothetical protein EVAR_43315_1 [Eumeta japonica]